MLTVGSLCSGAGGLDRAVADVLGNVRTAWVSDVDPDASRVLAERFPGVPNLGDLTAVDWRRVEPVDVLCGGFPCQSWSLAGKRKHMEDERWLWPNFLEAVETIRPALVFVENVPGLMNGQWYDRCPCAVCPPCRGRELAHRPGGPVFRSGLGSVLGSLAEVGYDARWMCLRASDVGAPHRRDRVFLVAHAADTGGGRLWQQPVAVAERGGAALAGGTGAGVDRLTESEREPLLPTPLARDWKGAGYPGQLGSALLATPRASDGAKGGPNQRGSSGDLTLTSQVMLLPTPTASEATGPGRGGKGGLNLRTATSLLPTPTANAGDGEDRTMSADTAQRRRDAGRRMLDDAVALLPTPSAADALGGHESRGNKRGGELLLPGVAKLLPTPTPTPTPTAMDANASRNATASRSHVSASTNDTGWTLHDVAYADRWAQYGAAIARWEAVLGRPAPEPTVAGKRGGRRLSGRFTEWMMGWPEGWVTDVVDNTAALKLTGNGVVVQCAVAAYRALLEVIR